MTASVEYYELALRTAQGAVLRAGRELAEAKEVLTQTRQQLNKARAAIKEAKGDA